MCPSIASARGYDRLHGLDVAMELAQQGVLGCKALDSANLGQDLQFQEQVHVSLRVRNLLDYYLEVDPISLNH